MYKQYYFSFSLYIHIALIRVIILVISKYGLDVNFNSRVFQRTQKITLDPHSRRCHTFSQSAIISTDRAHRIQQNKCFCKQTGAFFVNFEIRKYVGKFNLRFNTNVTYLNLMFMGPCIILIVE